MLARLLLLLSLAGAVFAQNQQSRALSTTESVALREPIAVGKRIIAALSRYPVASGSTTRATADRSLLTRTPTLDLLHASGYISDTDFAFSHSCHATLQPVPAGASADHPVLRLQTASGELIFDARGEVTIRDHT
jgi:hypothetical protein